MGVLNFYAYSVEYYVEGQGSYDENGDYQPSSDPNKQGGWVFLAKCDAVPAGRNNTIQLPDGTQDVISFTIYNLPVGCREFKKGERIRIKALGKETYELEVKGFARYQHQCKIWA